MHLWFAALLSKLSLIGVLFIPVPGAVVACNIARDESSHPAFPAGKLTACRQGPPRWRQHLLRREQVRSRGKFYAADFGVPKPTLETGRPDHTPSADSKAQLTTDRVWGHNQRKEQGASSWPNGATLERCCDCGPLSHEHYKRNILLPFNGIKDQPENGSRTLSEAVGSGELVTSRQEVQAVE